MAAAAAAAESSKRRRKGDVSFTAEELATYDQTSELFRSNLYRLQIEELLREVSLTSYATTGLARTEAAVDAIRAVLERVLGERAPSLVEVVGSYALRTVTKPQRNLDVAVVMPDALFSDRDFLNDQYFQKRAAYLDEIEAVLRRHLTGIATRKTWFAGSERPRKPVLELVRGAAKGSTAQEGQKKHKKDKKKKRKRKEDDDEDDGEQTEVSIAKHFAIRLIPCLSKDRFPTRKLAPNRNCVRSCTTGDGDLLPTPYYNQLVREDMLILEHARRLRSLVASSPTCAEAMVLAKVWVRQHALGDMVNGFVLSLLLEHLVVGERKVSRQMSSYQLFRALLQFLSEPKNLTVDTVYGLAFDAVVMTDTEYNLLFRLNRAAVEQLRAEAGRSLLYTDPEANSVVLKDVEEDQETKTGLVSAVNSETQELDGFQALFITAVDADAQPDASVCVRAPDADVEQALVSRFLTSTDAWFADVKRHPAKSASVVFADFVSAIVRYALGTRARRVSCRRIDGSSLCLGLLLDARECERRVDLGPRADDKAAAAVFRGFWGDRSEMRRYKDGRILEAVVWKKEDGDTLEQLLRFALERHAPGVSVHVVSTQLTHALRYAPQTAELSEVDDTTLDERPELAQEKLGSAFAAFSKGIRSLKDVPLTVVSLQSTDPAFRRSAPFPPVQASSLSRKAAKWLDAVEVVLEFESSSSWPDDLMAVARIKTAFYIRMAASVREALGWTAIVSNEFVDMLVEGFAFRVRIFHEREVLMRKESAEVSDEERCLIHAPRHAGAMRGVHVRVPVFAGTSKLALRWAACNMLLGDCLRVETVELLVAHVCLSTMACRPYERPGSAHAGFLRFLYLIATHDWDERPVIVDMTEDMSAEDIAAIHAAFEAAPKAQRPRMFVATESDHQSAVWTGAKYPTTRNLHRIVELARTSFSYLIGLTSQVVPVPPPAHFLAVFKPSLNMYDALIDLDPAVLPRSYLAQSFRGPSGTAVADEKLQGRTKDSVRATAKRLPLIGFNPVARYVAELRAHYSRVAEFHYDVMGGLLIAVAWRPDALEKRPLSVARAAFAKPAPTVDTVTLNVDQMVQEFRDLGQGLVKAIRAKPTE